MAGRENGRCVRGLLAAHLPAPARGPEPSRAAVPPLPAPPRRTARSLPGTGRKGPSRRQRRRSCAEPPGWARRGRILPPCSQPRRREGPRTAAPIRARGGAAPGRARTRRGGPRPRRPPPRRARHRPSRRARHPSGRAAPAAWARLGASRVSLPQALVTAPRLSAAALWRARSSPQGRSGLLRAGPGPWSPGRRVQGPGAFSGQAPVLGTGRVEALPESPALAGVGPTQPCSPRCLQA